MANDTPTVVIDRSPEVSWDWARDLPATFPRWNGGITACQVLDGAEVAEGSRVRIEGRLLGRTLVSEGRFDVWDRPTRAHFSGSMGSFMIDSLLTVEEVDGGRRCRVSRSYTVSPKSAGPARLAAPVLGWMVRQRNKSDLRKLKALIEAET